MIEQMSFQITDLIKGFITFRAVIIFGTVYDSVLGEIDAHLERLATVLTHEIAPSRVTHQMTVEVSLVPEALSTQMAEIVLARIMFMVLHVLFELVFQLEAFTTDFTFIWIITFVCEKVHM